MKKWKKLWCILLAVLLCAATLGNVSVVSYAAKGDLGEGYNADNLNAEFTTIDGDKVSSSSQGVVTVLLFARTNGMCLNSTYAISSVCNSDWIRNDGVRVVIVDIDGASAETVRDMKEKNGNDDALFCYDETGTAGRTMFNYLYNTIGAVSSVTLPVTVVIDGNNKVQYCTTGSITADEIYSYVADLAAFDSPDEPSSGKLDVYVKGTFDEEEAFQVLELVNQARADQGKNPLKMDEVLVDKAMQRAAECSVYYDHTRPNGEPCFSILESPYTMGCAENIAAGYQNADAAVTGWLNSPGHYANIMNEDYESIGIGCFYQDGVKYWTQLFSSYSGTEKVKESNSEKIAVVQADSDNLGSLTLDYEVEELNVGETAKPILRLDNLGFGSSIPSTDNIVFKSSDETVAKVDEDGTLHVYSNGEAVITAVLGNVLKAEYEITVGALQNTNYTLNTIDGEEISTGADGTKEVTMLIFGSTTCGNTKYELQSISNSDWISNSKIRVIFVEISYADLETVKNFASKYDNNNIKFCYDEGIRNSQMFNDYLNMTDENLTTLPITILIDKNDKIRKMLSGANSADNLLNEMKRFAHLDGEDNNGGDDNTGDNNGGDDNTGDNNGGGDNTGDNNTGDNNNNDNNNIIMGDLNGDKKVNLNDATMLLRAAVGIITLTEEQEKIADLNNDNKINLYDAQILLRIAVGIAN